MNAAGDLDPAVASILATAREREPPSSGVISVDARSFEAALEQAEREQRVPIIAEVKRTSPTTEGERDDDPVELATTMEQAGASAISVLTESTHFGGTTDDLAAVRAAVDIPVLRKDFILEERELDAVAADLVLLIARFVDDDLPDLLEAARSRGFQPLVEVHTEDELAYALDIGASIIGINNRDLAQLTVDLGTFERLAPTAPPETTLIAESGIGDPADVRRMREAGADALLVGSSIMAGEVGPQTTRLVEATQ